MSYIERDYLVTQFTNFASRVATIFAKKAELPTKVSDLNNDSNYVSDAAYVHTDNNYTATDKNIVDNALIKTAQSLTEAEKAQVRANIGADADGVHSVKITGDETEYKNGNNVVLPAYPDVSEFITKTTTALENYYLKTESYSKTEIDNIVSALRTGAFKVVDTLPTTDISTSTIYLVLKTSSSETGNVYNEYIYINNKWELIGDTSMSLDGYLTKTAADEYYVQITDKEKSNIDFSTYFS